MIGVSYFALRNPHEKVDGKMRRATRYHLMAFGVDLVAAVVLLTIGSLVASGVIAGGTPAAFIMVGVGGFEASCLLVIPARQGMPKSEPRRVRRRA